MAFTLPLESMTVEEKIQTMESIWDSLCAKADAIVTPVWHGEVLAHREQAVKDGADQFEDWEQAKRDIRKQVS
ncbi:MAG: addiction module protein [Pseudomonadota bacterium]|jgi:hypothetical protein